MRLKSLELSGFKSFAKKGDLHFDTPITAIVGPNGSGKSNIAEGFRFALGEQSIKSLRGKKGEDLIFNGAKNSPKANRASVKVIFDNKDRLFNIDFDEVIVERIVHRDGSNDYFINKSAVRLKDIGEMLAAANIGSSGHHIISQGEADRILSASPKERREMIEDALGLKIYQYKRLESERKLGKTEENIKSVESLRREIAPHIKFLNRQVKKIEKAAEMRVELRDLYNDYLAREEVYIKEEGQRIERESGPLKIERDTLAKKIIASKSTLEDDDKQDGSQDKIISIESRTQETQVKKGELVRRLGRIEGSLDAYARDVERRARNANTDGNVARSKVQSVFSDIRDSLRDARESNDIEKIRVVLSKIDTVISDFRTAYMTDTSKVEEEDVVSHDNLIREKDEIEKEMKSVRDVEEGLTRDMKELRAELDRGRSENREAERTLFEAMTRQNEVMLLLNNLTSSLDQLKRVKNSFEGELNEGAVLIGRGVLQYDSATVRVDEVMSEDRSKQEERIRIIERIKIRLEDMGGGGSDDVIKEYEEATERDAFLGREVADLEKSADALRVLIDELAKKLSEEFNIGINKINTQFHDFFTLMFGGGSAKIFVVEEKKRRRKLMDELLGDDVDTSEEEEVEKGIEVDIALPHKKTKGLMMLSGGERALTSIALLFAISQVNPPPFVILDETDAALDEANSRKYGDMIAKLSENSQLILITHNRETMSRAGVLYGITMGSDGISKLLSVKFDEAVSVAK
ncbi:hypothetical protein COB55_04255 [Candidatus Wolfebacteria bacterium]|nr:MAG: hypothetical protein COB55_04255 [Candidatus Wolfebacteria bacterium]